MKTKRIAIFAIVVALFPFQTWVWGGSDNLLEGGEILFFLKNHRGDILKELSLSGDGTSEGKNDVPLNVLSPYGAALEETPPPGEQAELFTGYRRSQVTGLDDARARGYSSAIGRFLQVDPAVDPLNPNRYAYVAGNPINLMDPSGTVIINGEEPEVKRYLDMIASSSPLGNKVVDDVKGANYRVEIMLCRGIAYVDDKNQYFTYPKKIGPWDRRGIDEIRNDLIAHRAFFTGYWGGQVLYANCYRNARLGDGTKGSKIEIFKGSIGWPKAWLEWKNAHEARGAVFVDTPEGQELLSEHSKLSPEQFLASTIFHELIHIYKKTNNETIVKNYELQFLGETDWINPIHTSSKPLINPRGDHNL